MVTVGLEKGLRLECPRLRIGTETFFVVALEKHEHLDAAQERAVRIAHQYLTDTFGLDAFEAYSYCCACLEIRFGGPASPIVVAVVPDPIIANSD